MYKLYFILLFCCSVSAFAGTDIIGNESEKRQPIVFIAGFDEGENTYYINAKHYFTNANYQVVEDAQTLVDILNWLRLHYDAMIYGDIHIVSHSNPWRGLSMKTAPDGERITVTTLEEALVDKKIIPLASEIISKQTKIIFHSCGLGKNEMLLSSLKKAFTQHETVNIYASIYFNVFGGKYSGHYLAKTYYGYYPTAHSPDPRALAHEFAQNYPNVQTDWETVLKTRTEQLSGEWYTYRFNIPVVWEFEFEDKADIPKFNNKEEIINWISEDENLINVINEFNIPIEKFRWLTKVRGNTLFIKGKTTVLCVMQPVMRSNTKEYLPVLLTSESYTKL